MDHNVVLVDHCTKAKRDSSDKPDRLFHHRLASDRQENIVVPQYIWEDRDFRLTESAVEPLSMEFKDTYNFVLNSKPGTKILECLATMAPVPHLCNNSIPQAMLCEFQRYSIVMMMRAGENGKKHLDFTYEPRDCVSFRIALFSSL